MNLSHPNFINLMGMIQAGTVDFLQSGVLSTSYLLTASNLRGNALLYSVMNTLSAFEQAIGRTFAMMEKDLGGFYLPPADKDTPTYIHDGAFSFRGKTYSKLALCPLLMDFSKNPVQWNNVYYTYEQEEKITTYANDTLDGIDQYRKENPNGLLEFFPFIGINPPVHDASFIENLLSTYINTTLDKTKETGKKRFYGIKIYPPLGTNPWPDKPKEMDKVRLIYDFCQANRIPIITHCDNQGFRGLSVKESWHNSSPATWENVLKAYPDLYLDFAHVGYQYSVADDVKKSLPIPLPLTGEWTRKILELMSSYPHVYSDISFTGCMPDFYHRLKATLAQEKDESLIRRFMFGSDFSVNLMKIPSYLSYYNLLDSSPMTDEEVQLICHDNPLGFLGLR
jgi:predicted TIM-barrel fold metal-dependent hydrolase